MIQMVYTKYTNKTASLAHIIGKYSKTITVETKNSGKFKINAPSWNANVACMFIDLTTSREMGGVCIAVKITIRMQYFLISVF